MRIGVVYTAASPCRCAESVSLGLRALGHKIFMVDSGKIEIHAPELAESCDLVIDHTDTYCGRGLYRPFVRFLLESCGARVVGSASKDCFIADNKAAAKQILSNAGIPVPPGIVIQSNTWKLPDWLTPPLVLKPAFEHMSRGVRLVRTEQEAYAESNRIFESLRQPILVESFIPGRELAVSLLGNSPGIQVLPVLEWQSGTEILDEDFKVMEPEEEAHKIARPDLDCDIRRDLEHLARKAFIALELRDYARFDLRLSPGGSLYFLEANTTPSLEPEEALAVSAQWAGLDYAALVHRLISAAQRRYAPLQMQEPRTLEIAFPAGSVEMKIPEGVHPPPESTAEMARLLDVSEGDEVLELGCGSGLLSIAAAKQGARHIIATDLDSKALQATQANARQNGVGDLIEVRVGSWYEALGCDSSNRPVCGDFDVIIASPPQTPGPNPFGPKYGGTDGASHLAKIIQGAPGLLKSEKGRLWLLTISLANPHRVWKLLKENFAEVEIVRRTQRPFTLAEYDALDRNLFDYLRSLRSEGISEFVEFDDEHCYFQNLIIRAAKPRQL